MKNYTLLQFLRFLRKGDKDLFEVPKSEQKDYLESFPEPRNDIERSLFQFKCQSYFWPRWKVPVYNICAFFISPFVLLLEWVRSINIKKSNHYDALSELKGMEEVVPDELREEYEIRFDARIVKGMLRTRDLWFVLKVVFSTFPNTFFALKIMMKLAQYSEMIYTNTPRAIVVHGEFSFASSILTCYCEDKNVRHINVMHGEKLYHIYDSFFRFDKCYVWSEYYKELFIKMRAEANQFCICVPPSLRIKSEDYNNDDAYSDYKYYLADFTGDEIERIVLTMNKFKERGVSVRYRVHPRYLNLDIIQKYAPQSDIEDPRKVSIQESVANCRAAVGSYSTVLLQAYMSGKEVILDDVNYREQFDRLEEFEYWLAKEKCQRLSQII